MERPDILKKAYTQLYTKDRIKHDSPERSRVLLGASVVYWLTQFDANKAPYILDIGSGPSVMASEVNRRLRDKPNLHRPNWVSLDIVEMPPKKNPKAHSAALHKSEVTADSRNMPFGNAIANLVVSNHSIDMLDVNSKDYRSALSEMYRVMKIDGSFMLNLHHASLYPTLCESVSGKTGKSGSMSLASQYYSPDASNPYYDEAEPIIEDLTNAGFSEVAVELQEDKIDSWWFVTGQKTV